MIETSPPFHFFTVVWGATRINHFIKATLPSFVAPQNLGAFGNHPHDLYTIFTTEDGAQEIYCSEAFKLARSLLPTEVHVVNELPSNRSGNTHWSQAWTIVNALYSKSMRRAAKAGAAICLLQPDGLWSNGSLAHLRTIIASGKKVAMTASCHTVPEAMVPAVLARCHSEESPAISLSGRELVALAIQHLHDYSRCHIWDNDLFLSSSPGMLLWRVGDEGIIGRHFCPAPQAILFPADAPDWPSAPGFELLSHLETIFTLEDMELITDSDQYMSCGFEWAKPGDPGYLLNSATLDDKPDISKIAHWIQANTGSIAHWSVRQSVYWHTRDLSHLWGEQDERVCHAIQALIDYALALKQAASP